MLLLDTLFLKISADLIATKFGYSRNDVDGFAVSSQKRAAWHNKMAFDKSIIPVTDINGLVHLAKDEYIEANTTLEVLSTYPGFKMGDLLFDQTAIDKYSH
jgi:acetyl-CoA C-acetyltransferase